jgi:hypothetical protein
LGDCWRLTSNHRVRNAMLRFPIDDLLDQKRCHDLLFRVMHPEGLRCPRGHALPPDQAPHDRHRAPIFDYRCRECGAVYNLFTGSIWSKSRLPCSKIVLILRGIAHGVPTAHLSRWSEVSRHVAWDWNKHLPRGRARSCCARRALPWRPPEPRVSPNFWRPT